MKKLLILTIISMTCRLALSQHDFGNYFEMKTLRIDLIHAGNFENEKFYLEQIKQEPFWAGSKNSLIDPFNYGEYRMMVYDSVSDELIYSKGYGSLFREWQTTTEAQKLSRSFYESYSCPFPLSAIKIVIQSRNRKNIFNSIFELYINPKNYFIKKDKVYDFNSFRVFSSSIPAKCIDLVIIPDGYTEREMVKFKADAQRFANYLFNCSPYKDFKDKFNIRAVEAYSHDSGTDIPKDSIWKSTIVNTSFYTFDSERYLMTYDIKSVRDIASLVPYDQILILVNSTKYGGGGIYNFYNVCSSDHPDSEFVFTHEFGHGFAALADEYFTSDVSYNDYYDLTVEPFQPNITTLTDFESKWKDMVDPSTPFPTPAILKYSHTIGAFEGGGYVANGIYRPMQDCSMKSRIIDGFCPVCKKAIEAMIIEQTR